MKEKIILKSAHPEEYPDLVVKCRVIPNDKIGEYLDTIPEERKFYGYKSAPVLARTGKPGEVIKTKLTTIVDGKEYILSEEENTVKERSIGKDYLGEDIMQIDIVVTNNQSTSNEQYVVKAQKFYTTYKSIGYKKNSDLVIYEPQHDSRLLTQVDENVIIMTSWGAPAVCLAGSYIVTYNAEENDYNTIEKGAFESTYTKEDQPTKKLKR